MAAWLPHLSSGLARSEKVKTPPVLGRTLRAARHGGDALRYRRTVGGQLPDRAPHNHSTPTVRMGAPYRTSVVARDYRAPDMGREVRVRTMRTARQLAGSSKPYIELSCATGPRN